MPTSTLSCKMVLAILLVIFNVFISSTDGNFYGKRGDKVDDSLMQILQGGFPDMVDRQLDAQMTIRTIAKVLQEYEQRQIDAIRGHDVNK